MTRIQTLALAEVAALALGLGAINSAPSFAEETKMDGKDHHEKVGCQRNPIV